MRMRACVCVSCMHSCGAARIEVAFSKDNSSSPCRQMALDREMGDDGGTGEGEKRRRKSFSRNFREFVRRPRSFVIN